jgi:thiol-disulfide isomerase/thioredoxin
MKGEPDRRLDMKKRLLRRIGPPALAVLVLVGCSGGGTGASLGGSWRAWLDSPGGELPFGLEFAAHDGSLEAWIINGTERLSVERVELAGDRLLLGIEHYDARIEATLDGGRLDGEWSKTGKGGDLSRLDFHALAGDLPRFPTADGAAPTTDISGRWAVDFAEDDKPALGLFHMEPDGRVAGTFLTATGDYRYLAGRLDGERLRLSVFDGAHAFLFDSRLQPDGTLAGDFWSRESWHETWTARRDEEAALEDAFEQTHWIDEVPLEEIAYPDLGGRMRSLADPDFAGQARLIVVFGSWCPNCNDHTNDLVELYGRYRDDGLSVLGLAFEMTGSFERDARQVRKYIEHHGIEYPVLVAGTADKDEASAAFPLVDRVRSFPTTLFLDRDGRVRTVHSGYSGPATGQAHLAQRRQFEERIENLLGLGDPADRVSGERP